jgi:hypothetical protein
MIKNTKDFDIKTLTDATVEFNQKLFSTITEASIHAFKEFTTFSTMLNEGGISLAKQWVNETPAELIEKFNDTMINQWSTFTKMYNI